MKLIIDYLNQNKKNIVGLTKKLISIPTINPPGKNYERLVSVLEKECAAIGLKTRRITVPESFLRAKGIKEGSKRIILIAEWDVAAGKTLHIAGHYDVVPATGRWHTEPFRPVVKNGRIYGRGTEDMKGTIASIIFAVKALKACGVMPRVNIQLSFAPDEEIGGETGFGWLVRNKFIKADYAISEGYSDEWVSCGNKGVLWFDIEVSGKSAHASSPKRGVNAFEKMIKVANALIDLKNKVEKRRTKFLTRYDMDRNATFVMGGELKGGNKVNIVPDKCMFSIDRRLLPEETVKQAVKEIRSAIEKLKKKDKDLRVRVKVRVANAAAISDAKGRLFEAFRKSAKEITGKNTKSGLLSGATDLRFLMIKKIPCLGYSARGGEKWHSDNEFVYIKSLIETSQILARTISNL